MPDLKAAAKWLRMEGASAATEMEVYQSGSWHDKCKLERDAFILAAQALDVLAWAENQKQPIECVLGKWRILGRDQYGHLKYYYADTPLGVLLAAMEGEGKDGL